MIFINKDWNYYPEEDQYRHVFTDFTVTGTYINDYTKNWGRPFYKFHLIGILDKLFKEYQEWSDRAEKNELDRA